MENLNKLSSNKMFGGWHERYSHQSQTTNTNMTFAIYLPPQVGEGKKVPVLYFLSGLTCTDENFSTKAGAQQYAAKYGIALVMPDTSPRGEGVADNENYDLGQGAGFYLTATKTPWKAHYNMYDYVVSELPKIIEENFPVTKEKSIFGHSMGGHGALQIGIKNYDSYKSISAFAPIVNPSQTPWGQNAFTNYLGDNKEEWNKYDSTYLLSQTDKVRPILIDQGLADNFYPAELQPEEFAKVAEDKKFDVSVNLHEGYDHSYYFIASFVEKHIEFHAKYLGLI